MAIGKGLRLLNFDLSACVFKLLLDVSGFLLRDVFFNRLRRAFNEVLSFLKAEIGADATDFFMTLIFLSPPSTRTTVNSVCSSAASAGAAVATGRHRQHGDGSSSRDAPLFFKQLGQFGSFEDGQCLDRSSTNLSTGRSFRIFLRRMRFRDLRRDGV